jgi:hypothetical protein
LRSASPTACCSCRILAQGLAGLGVELLGLGENLDLVAAGVEQPQLLMLGLLLGDRRSLRLIAARAAGTESDRNLR